MKQLLSVAPMMDWTDRHCRYFHRLLSPHAWLYTEMVTTGALIHGDRDRHLKFNAQEHPVVLQLGGSDPVELALSARIGEDYGYDEINLNCGCPSDRVQKGKFGACLMAEPNLVADSVSAMIGTVDIPVTVKCRIGIDNTEDFAFLDQFVSAVKSAGCRTFIIHARKAWLKGLSPKENREIPPLKYDVVAALKAAHPDLTVILNGGVKTLGQVADTLQTFDGVMIGREAYQNPWCLAEFEALLHNTPVPARADIALAMIPYIQSAKERYGASIHNVTRHMLGLYNGLPGARHWRRQLGGAALSAHDPAELIQTTLAEIERAAASRLAA